jgi:trans-aconitate methyltransferase
VRASIRCTPYFHDFEQQRAQTPLPPTHLQERVGGSKDFRQIGAELTSLLLTAIGKHRPLWEPEKILDWGCGCGRVIAQLRKLLPRERIFGCDIDDEAIAWNRKHLPGSSSLRIAPYPPTIYPDGEFDVIYGISVMTHLDEKTHFCWLQELQRIARSGAILALSVIGSELRHTNMPAQLVADYARKGFATFVPEYSEMLREFSHPSYYKESYHSPAYVSSTWSRYFEIMDYIETKHQDLVVLRAP